MRRLLIILTCFLIFSSPIQAETKSCEEHHCIVVIDAGSTGTRAHLYSYDLDGTQTAINITELWNNRVKPGLASIEPDQTTVTAYLNELLSSEPASQVPTYFFATAGMRLLPPTRQQLYYELIQQWFSEQSKLQLVQSRTLTGREEGVFAWLAVNDTLGTLRSGQPSSSIGVMDMGGASVQIVFPAINATTQQDNNAQITVNLFGQTIPLLSYSFLGLGQTQVTYQYLDTASCFSNDYPLPDGELGKGDAYLCAQRVSVLINGVHNVNQIIPPQLRLNPVLSWYVIGGIVNLPDNKLFHFTNNQFTNQNLIEQGNSLACDQQWSEITTQLPNDPFAFGYCLFPSYFYALMVDGYGLSPTQPIHYIPARFNLDWTKGVVLFH